MEKDQTAAAGKTPSDTSLSTQWKAVCGLLRAEIGEAAYQSWLKPMTAREVVDGELRISVPTRFMRDWIIAHYLDRLYELWAAENAAVKSVDVYIQSEREMETAPSKKKTHIYIYSHDCQCE